MRTLFLSLICLSFFACENKSQTPVTTQHDTIKVVTNAEGKKTIEQDTIIQNGEYIKHYANGVIKMRGMMKNGKRDGLWKSWYDNGLPWSETTFADGKKTGRTTTWYENNQKRYDGFYTNDVESGKWIFWNEKGEVVQQMDYDKK